MFVFLCVFLYLLKNSSKKKNNKFPETELCRKLLKLIKFQIKKKNRVCCAIKTLAQLETTSLPNSKSRNNKLIGKTKFRNHIDNCFKMSFIKKAVGQADRWTDKEIYRDNEKRI